MTCKLLKKSIILVGLLSLIFGCNIGEYNTKINLADTEVTNDFEAVEQDIVEQPHTENKLKDLKIIKSSNVRYKVKDVKKATERVKKIATIYDAYISDLRLENNLYKKENRFTLKVPAVNFDTLMDSISCVAEFVDFENITTKDVTSDYIDIESRLKTKQEVKERYESILRKKAKSVEDLLDVEQKLQIIQEEIESSLGRLKYLTNKVAFSTVQVDLYETVEYKEEPLIYKKTFGSEFQEAFMAGWDFTKSIFIGIIYFWPLLVLSILLFIFIKKRIKK